MFDAIQPFDNSILFAVQSLHNPVLDFLMPIVSFISDNGFMWLPIIALMIIFRRTRKVGIAMAVTFAICAGAGYLLKHMIARPRPTDLFPQIPLLVDRPEANVSFPSGHTIMSAGMAVCLWFRKWYFGLPATIFALGVGFSRVYLFCHNPSDVVASCIIALIIALAVTIPCMIIFRNFWKPRGQEGRRFSA